EGSSLLMKVRSKRQQTDYRDQFEKRQQDLKTLFASNRHYFTTALTSDSLIDTTQRIVLRQSQRSE
ncbi:MAG: hypothetical protein ACI8UP_004052, partial [Porticoccaceae bacterium]